MDDFAEQEIRSSAQRGLAGTIKTEGRPATTVELDMLLESTARAEDMFQKLTEKLVPVLSLPAPREIGNDSAKDPALPEVPQRIKDMRMKIVSLTDAMYDVFKRLEV